MISPQLEAKLAAQESDALAAQVQRELNQLGRDPRFATSPKHYKALVWVVNQKLIGQDHWVKEQTVGIEVWDHRFDPRTDTRVRVAFHRIRELLRDYYETDGRNNPVILEIPKGTYVPRFIPNTTAAAAVA